MAKVFMRGFIVYNVEPCPKCDATDYARRDDVLNMVVMCCDKCDYEAPGAVLVQGNFDIDHNPKAFIEMTRHFFNHWNKAIAESKNEKPKRVRIMTE